jgi:type IV pilus assembly protein PilY1
MDKPKGFGLSRLGLACAALGAAAGMAMLSGSVIATSAVTPVSISNIPLTVAIPAHPQVLIAIGNSESMDGDLSGAIMTGSGALSNSAVAAGLANSASPVNYQIPSGFTPPLNTGSGGYAPYTVTTSGVQYDNSASRLNVAKAGITAILNDFMEYADFALEDYDTSGLTEYTTWVYYMSPSGSNFTFTSTASGNTCGQAATCTVPNPCYNANVSLTDSYDSACKAMRSFYGGGYGVTTQPYLVIGDTSDDPAINDVFYAPAGYQPPVCISYNPSVTNPYTHWTLSQYNVEFTSYPIVEYYSVEDGCDNGMVPTNAGYIPYSPQVYQAERGFGYGANQSATDGTMVVGMQSSGAAPTSSSVAAAIAHFTPYLAAETNSTSTTEIKASAGNSPLAGLLKTALSYYNGTNPASTNGCPPTRYVVLVTDGLPTLDLNNHSWPPLGTVPGNGYGVTATFNSNGSLASTNDQAITDTITELQALKSAGIKTYIIGLGAGVETAANPEAAATLTAMAIAGGTNTYFAATSPGDLTNDMQVILAQILAANESTASATVNTTGLDTSSIAYQPSFDTSDTDQDWTGNLMAYPINATTGAVETSMPAWSAQAQLDTQDAGTGYDTGRVIATYDPVTHLGIPFRWTTGTPTSGIATSTTLGMELETNTSDTNGQDALNYLRGERSMELANGGHYRNRTHVLGDLVDSAPLYIGAANGPYQSSSYYSFEASVASRTPVLYAGAGDGMLHAFNANTGSELFAFIPNGVFPNLINLTSPFYNEQHRFYVDGSPQAADVQFSDGTWHTIVVGGENAGGSTIYALDVTNPANITSPSTESAKESALASAVLWEFSDSGMGLSYSTPAIAQTALGASGSNLGFTVFFGNGYNSSSQRPILYAVDPKTGTTEAKIDLCAQVPSACDTTKPNGLSSPVVINDIGGISAPATTLYAGDLQGNLWRVDISSATPASWTVTVLFQATDPSGARQPITTTPVVSLNPDFPRVPGVMVYFGTGQMLGIPDLSSTQVQTFYGVYDSGSNASTLSRSNSSMVAQTLTALSSSLRKVSGGPIVLPTQTGWYVDMTLLSGERFVTDPRIDAGAVIATTVQPSSNTCTAGDVSWLMEFNFGGGTFLTPQFDTNNDGTVNSSDTIANGMVLGGASAGVYGTAVQVLTTPCTTNCKRIKLVTESNTSGSSIQTVVEKGSQAQRTSWREIR